MYAKKEKKNCFSLNLGSISLSKYSTIGLNIRIKARSSPAWLKELN